MKGLRFTVRWSDHNDLKNLENILLSVKQERRKCRGPLPRRFTVTEGIFKEDGIMVDLPKLISCARSETVPLHSAERAVDTEHAAGKHARDLGHS
ncbi:hypothetical protein EDB89DRAFT_2049801 [Lactarius sanguifluus]|nr:hypothetical protein EDB89DRAFT_2049801 [Lactarius sanguifluus]